MFRLTHILGLSFATMEPVFADWIHQVIVYEHVPNLNFSLKFGGMSSEGLLGNVGKTRKNGCQIWLRYFPVWPLFLVDILRYPRFFRAHPMVHHSPLKKWHKQLSYSVTLCYIVLQFPPFFKISITKLRVLKIAITAITVAAWDRLRQIWRGVPFDSLASAERRLWASLCGRCFAPPLVWSGRPLPWPGVFLHVFPAAAVVEIKRRKNVLEMVNGAAIV